MNNRNIELDIVRCVGNYLIVLMHAGAALQYCKVGGLEVDFWTFICGCTTQMALPALFLISGFLLFKNYSISCYSNKLKRRVRRLLVPYVIWNVTFVVFYLLCGKFIPRLSIRVASFGLDSFSGAFSKILDLTVHPIDGPLWFLRTLFVLSIVSPLFYLLVKSSKKYIRYFGFMIVAVLYIVCYFLEITDKLLMTYPLYSIALFYLGGLLATSGKNMDSLRFKSAYWLIPYCVGLFMIIAIVFNPGSEHTVLGATMNDIGKLMLTPGLFYMVSKLNQSKLSNSKFFSFTKDMSFFAYAGHFLFCSMIMHTLASQLGRIENGKATILILAFCLIGVPVMAIIYKFGKRFAPKVMKLYDGTL